MTIYENTATLVLQNYLSPVGNIEEAGWKGEVLFNFLIKPFNSEFSKDDFPDHYTRQPSWCRYPPRDDRFSYGDVSEVLTQEQLTGTVPDLTIRLKNGRSIRYEIKINDAELTGSESTENTRDAFLILKKYRYEKQIPESAKKLYWEDLFREISEHGGLRSFEALDIVRRHLGIREQTLTLSRMEVAKMYKRNDVIAVFDMIRKLECVLSEKICPGIEKKLQSKLKEHKIISKTHTFIKNESSGIDFYALDGAERELYLCGVYLDWKNEYKTDDKLFIFEVSDDVIDIHYDCDDNIYETDKSRYLEQKITEKEAIDREDDGICIFLLNEENLIDEKSHDKALAEICSIIDGCFFDDQIPLGAWDVPLLL